MTNIELFGLDTELIHMSMYDLLDCHVYFRLNPYLSAQYTLDEIDPAKLEQMNKDAKSYVRRNKLKVGFCATLRIMVYNQKSNHRFLDTRRSATIKQTGTNLQAS